MLNNLVFADDIALVANNKKELQKLLKIAEKYARKWKFSFNTKKCKLVMFNKKTQEPKIYLDGDQLEVVDSYKYLGVWFSSDLSWKLHKETVLAKARRRAYLIMGLSAPKLLSVRTCVRLWEVMVRPTLEYAAEIWGGGPWEERDR